MNDIQGLVDQYYEKFYSAVHGMQWKQTFYSPHRYIERRYKSHEHLSTVLEVGGDEGQHLEFINHKYDTYIVSDLRLNTRVRLLQIQSGIIPSKSGEYFSIADATQLKYDSGVFDRVVSGCLLLHLPNTLEVLEEWLRVLKIGGHIDALVPYDESFLVRCYRALFSRRKAKKLGFNQFDVVNAFEHVTHASRIFTLANHGFPRVSVHVDHFPPLIGRFRPLRAFSVLRITKVPR